MQITSGSVNSLAIRNKFDDVFYSTNGTKTMTRAMTLADWSLLLAAALLLGSTFLFLNITIKEISPFTTAAFRTLIAAPICWGLMRGFGSHLPLTRQGWVALFWLGLLTAAIPFGTISWGQQHIESGMGGILFGTMPILMVLLAPIFLAEETFTRRRLAGGVVGLAGIILLIGPSVLANASTQILGIAITFLGPLSHTLGAIYAHRQTNLTPPTMATGQMIFGALILVPLAFATAMTPHARATSTAATSIFASIIAWYMDPVPDASTANRTLGKLVARGYRDAMISAMSSPASVGLSPTFTPASRKASILASAVPLPPETIAPACPIFFPGGAVTPAM